MYLTLQHLEVAMPKLEKIHPFFGMSFLAFKREELPVGLPVDITFMTMAERFMQEFYRPTPSYDGFYNPFKSSSPKQRWVKPRYPSTSLQRITTDTFGQVFLHTKETSSWAWHADYISRLSEELSGTRIPAVYLAIWLFRDMPIEASRPGRWLIDSLIKSFKLRPLELEVLFNLDECNIDELPLAEKPIKESGLLDLLGNPPGHLDHRGHFIKILDIKGVGPAAQLRYEPAERLNLMTGDNSLGKTFLLDCLWWGVTNSWGDRVALPFTKSDPAASITAILGPTARHEKIIKGTYSSRASVWSREEYKGYASPLAVYARYDGSFAVWDAARGQANPINDHSLILGRDEVWDGCQRSHLDGKTHWITNGLIRDWALWQLGGDRYQVEFDMLKAALETLSPSMHEPLTPGKLMRIPGDAREIPTIGLPYGSIPVTHASAGIRRVIAMAYLLVWIWHEHTQICRMTGRRASTRMIVIVDEIEAHLHPRWQRSIVPSLMQVIKLLSDSLSPQVHLATHSPLVLASSEDIYDPQSDALHSLDIVAGKVALDRHDFVKHGNVDDWLTSNVFGLKSARSIEAESAIDRAKSLQLSRNPSPNDIELAHKRLRQVLASNDDFWPRWLYFASKHGVVL